MRWRRRDEEPVQPRGVSVPGSVAVAMSLPAILWAMYEAPAQTNPTEKCVLMVLAEHANPSGANAFPSWERIAKTVGVSTRTIGSTLSSLQAKGLIRRGDQRIAEAAVRSRGKSRAYAPTVWDLIMDGSHAAATQAHLPPAVAEDRQATASRRGQLANVQVSKPAGSADLDPNGPAAVDAVTIPAGQEQCRSCRSNGECSEACSLTSVRHEVSRRSGVKPASDKPSTSTKNLNPPPPSRTVLTGVMDEPETRPRCTWSGDSPDLKLADAPQAIEEMVQVVKAALPNRLGRQLLGASLRSRCSALMVVGWTSQQVVATMTNRDWHGAGVGAALAWLSGLTHEVPPSEVAVHPKPLDSPLQRPQVPSTVNDPDLIPLGPASADSPARRDALALAASAAARGRARRSSELYSRTQVGPGRQNSPESLKREQHHSL